MVDQGLRIGFRVGPFPSVSETFIREQIQAMISYGHRVSVLASDSNRELLRQEEFAWISDLQSLAFVNSSTQPWSTLESCLPYRIRQKRLELVERQFCRRNDVILCNFGWFGQEFAKHRAQINDTHLVTIFHGADMSTSLKTPGSNPYNTLFEVGDLHLPISKLWKNRLIELGAPQEKTQVFRMGVDLRLFDYQHRSPPPNGIFRLATVGRMVEKKGLEYTLRSLAQIKQTLPKTKVQLDIMGDGPLWSNLVQLATELDVSDMVTFHGRVTHSEVSSRLKLAHAFILPSVTAGDGDMEGIPVALMEAMASGLPVISTFHSGIPELIEHNVNGLLANERDVTGLTEIILQTIQEPEQNKLRTAAARQTIQNQYDNDSLHRRLDSLLRSVAQPI